MDRNAWFGMFGKKIRSKPKLNPRAIESGDGRVLAGASDLEPRRVTVFVNGDDSEVLIVTGDAVKISKGGKVTTIHKWGHGPGLYIPF